MVIKVKIEYSYLYISLLFSRTSITTKCADESKMFRTRQQNKKKRKLKFNRENIPPGSESDDSDER